MCVKCPFLKFSWCEYVYFVHDISFHKSSWKEAWYGLHWNKILLIMEVQKQGHHPYCLIIDGLSIYFLASVRPQFIVDECSQLHKSSSLLLTRRRTHDSLQGKALTLYGGTPSLYFNQFFSYPPMGSTTIPLGDTSPSTDRVRLFPS